MAWLIVRRGVFRWQSAVATSVLQSRAPSLHHRCAVPTGCCPLIRTLISCQLNSELCVSCGLVREKIRKWHGMKRPEKMAAVQGAAARLKALKKYF